MTIAPAASIPAVPRPPMQRAGRRFFPIASGALLLLTLVGFSDNLLTDVGQPSNFDPKFIVHGLLCLAWMIALFAQSCLVFTRRVGLHRLLGPWAFLVAIGVVASTAFVFWAVWKGWAALDTASQANRFLLPGYALLVWLAWRGRSRPDEHRRLIYLATLYMLGPILGRVYDPAVVPLLTLAFAPTPATVDLLYPPWFFAMWIAFFVSLWAYDRATLGRVHRVTWQGTAGFGAIWALVVAI